MCVEGTAVEGRGQDGAWLTAAAGQVRSGWACHRAPGAYMAATASVLRGTE